MEILINPNAKVNKVLNLRIRPKQILIRAKFRVWLIVIGPFFSFF